MNESPRLKLLLAVVGVLAIALIGGTLVIMGPAPPRSMTMSTGADGGAYQMFGERYRALMARHGIDLRLATSNGSVDNLQRLNDSASGVSVAFLQGGTTDAVQSPDLRSLGTVFYEPTWVFYRGEPPRRATYFETRRVSIGPIGSGTRRLALDLIAAIGGRADEGRLLALSSQEAASALLAGRLDMAVFVAPWESAHVRQLLAADGIAPLQFPRADAHVALRPYLNKLIVPQGVADLARDKPPHDLVLVAAKASLVVRSDLHPALQYLLLDVASQVHSTPGIFHRAGQFPSAEPIDLPLSDEARQYYQTGRPFLQRYLPFWLAVFVGRLLVILIPVVGVLLPVMRLLPALYGWAMRRRVFRLYGELKFLEAELESRPAGEAVDDLVIRLSAIEQRASHLKVPTAFAHFLYTVRVHIGLVRTRLMQREQAPQRGR
jgi:TRAP-type uncharacterized transport system substrate-binding protein